MEFLKFPKIVFGLVVYGLLAAHTVYAYDCSGLPAYVNGQAVASNQVLVAGDHAYRCDVGGWCTIGGPYEPGVGWAWTYAWTDLGECENTVNEPPQVTVSLPDVVARGESVQITAMAQDPDGTIDSWELAVYQYTLDGPQGKVVISSGSSIGGTAGEVRDFSGSWTATMNYEYIAIAKATDNSGVETTQSKRFLVRDTDQIVFTLSHPGSLEHGTVTRISVSASKLPTIPSVSVTVDGQPLFYSGSSSSGSSGGGHSIHRSYEWRATGLGPHTVVAKLNNDLVRTGIIEVIDATQFTVTHPDTVEIGATASIMVLASNLTTPELPEILLTVRGVEPSIVSSSSSSGGGSYSYSRTYAWTASSVGPHEVLATLNGGVNRISTIQVTDGTTGQDDCQSIGVDPSGINVYPDWTRTNWEGTPDHANGGDRMVHNSAVYEAKWWTASVPGSDESWKFICAF